MSVWGPDGQEDSTEPAAPGEEDDERVEHFAGEFEWDGEA